MSNANTGLSPLPLSGGALNSDAGNSAPVVGARRRRATKKALKALKMKLKKMGGAAEEAEVATEKVADEMSEGGRRRRGSRKTRRGKKSLFGLKY